MNNQDSKGNGGSGGSSSSSSGNGEGPSFRATSVMERRSDEAGVRSTNEAIAEDPLRNRYQLLRLVVRDVLDMVDGEEF
jgi:hypothetical protein